ncbi:MAG: dockerin type I domain-containing protein, partial [Pirellulales bacterium]
YNDDGQVTSADYNAWKSTFGMNVTAGAGADGNNDGKINAADYTIWRDHLSGAGAAATAVPEPTGLLLIVLGGLALLLAEAGRVRQYRLRTVPVPRPRSPRR